MRRLADSYPAAAHHLRLKWHGIDLVHLASKVGCPGDSLGALCRGVLGRSLDKSHQCSNWARRPLSEDQLRYAALDAWALLPLLSRMLANGEEASGFAEVGVAALAAAQLPGTAPPGAAVDAASETFDALSAGGAAAVARALAQLEADSVRMQLVATGRVGIAAQSRGLVVCKTVACARADGSAEGPRYALCVLPLDAELCLERLAAVAGLPAPARWRLATGEELRSVFRQPRGSVGPIGPALLAGAAVLLEGSLLEPRLCGGGAAALPILECGGGAPFWQLQVLPEYLQELTNARVGSFLAAAS